MKCAEELVPRHLKRSVVHFKIPMMHLVMKHSKLKALATCDPYSFKTCMRRDRVNRVEHQVADHMHRMRRDDEMDQARTKIKQVLNRVHRQARPWPDVGVSMMQRVETIQKFSHAGINANAKMNQNAPSDQSQMPA